MKNTYDQIINLLNSKGEKLGMNAGVIGFSSQKDPGPDVPGFTTRGVSETISIPDGYMKRAGAANAKEFLDWLIKQ